MFRLNSKKDLIHRNGVIQVLVIPSESLIFTISYDQKLKWLEATGDNETQSEIENPNRTVFTCMCWDHAEHELYLADDKGYIHVFNAYEESKMFSK